MMTMAHPFQTNHQSDSASIPMHILQCMHQWVGPCANRARLILAHTATCSFMARFFNFTRFKFNTHLRRHVWRTPGACAVHTCIHTAAHAFYTINFTCKVGFHFLSHNMWYSSIKQVTILARSHAHHVINRTQSHTTMLSCSRLCLPAEWRRIPQHKVNSSHIYTVW